MMAAEISERGGPFWHGGVAGLEPGHELLPGRVTGASSAHTVKVTTDYAGALGHAARWPGGGDVYRVAVEHPTGPPVPSPFPMLRTGKAIVVAVARRGVHDPKAMLRPELANRKPIKRRRANAK
jgi:hypothetical protein